MTAVVQTIQLPPTPTDSLLQRVSRPGSGTIPSLSNSLSTTPESDELTELRVSFPRRPLPTPPTMMHATQQRKHLAAAQSHSSVPAQVSPPISPKSQTHSRRTVRSSFYAHMGSTGLATISAKPEILSRLLDNLSWNDFHGLSSASRSLRRIFLDPAIKDVVFGHFIPGYRRALSLRDKRVWEDTIRMDYTDLGLLSESIIACGTEQSSDHSDSTTSAVDGDAVASISYARHLVALVEYERAVHFKAVRNDKTPAITITSTLTGRAIIAEHGAQHNATCSPRAGGPALEDINIVPQLEHA